jgi:hypothetical protein
MKPPHCPPLKKTAEAASKTRTLGPKKSKNDLNSVFEDGETSGSDSLTSTAMSQSSEDDLRQGEGKKRKKPIDIKSLLEAEDSD